MYRTKFNCKNFLYDPITFYEDEGDEEALDILSDYKNNTILELFTYFSNIQSRDDIDEDEKELRLRVLKHLIHKKLELVDHVRYGYFLDELEGELQEIRKELKELTSNFKRHRHDKDKSYTEKPIW